MTGTFERLKTALADHYTLERKLGAGGMATVYLARDIRHNRQAFPDGGRIVVDIRSANSAGDVSRQHGLDETAELRRVQGRRAVPDDAASHRRPPRRITVGLNWFDELRARSPASVAPR